MKKKTVNYEEYCRRCQHYEYGKHRGVVCGLTHRKPTFQDECENLVIDKEKASEIEQQESAKKMRKELKGWGIALIILGVIHLVLAGYLSVVWGVLIIILGIVNLVVMKREMFIANGAALVLIGIMNTVSTLDGPQSGFSFWRIFGIMQIIWGVQEIIKFKKYSA